MSVSLSLFAGAGWPFFTDSGTVLSGGLVYTYAAGTTTPVTTYSSVTGLTANSNPIVMNSAGRVAGEVWLTDGVGYKFVVKTSTGVTIGTYDNIYSSDSSSVDALALLAASSGSSLVGFINSGTGATARTVQAKLRDTVSVKDFGAVGDGVTDDTAAIQAAINAVCAASTTGYGGVVYLPPGVYKTTSTIYTYSGTTSCGIRGAGQFATSFSPSGNFTVLNIAGQRADSGDFSIVFPTTAASSINSACVGVEFCSSALQMSYQTVRNITVYYAYNSFVLNNTSLTMYLTTLSNLTSLRAANWGFYLNCAVGGTTLTLNQCYARCDNSVNANYGSGMYIYNFDDVQLNQCAIDNSLNNWLQAVNYSQMQMNGVAFESCSITVNNQRAVQLNGISTVINGVKLIAITYNTGGTANVFSMLSSAQNLTISGLAETTASVTATTVYYAWLNAATSHLFVLDRSVLPSQVNDNGWFANHAYEGVRKTSVNSVPNYGTWIVGDYVKNGAPSVGQPKGWYCTVAGTSGTWVSEGNL